MNHAGSSEVRTNRQMHRNIREDRIYIDGNTARKLQSIPVNRNRMQNDQIRRQHAVCSSNQYVRVLEARPINYVTF